MKSNMEPTDQDRVMRGKRTKRSRQSVPFILTCSSSRGRGSSVENSEEDEEMANCLIMLAHSGSFSQPNIGIENPDFYLYECKTCNKSFSSFQALGGHRASHKKPKSDQEHKVVVSNDLEDENKRITKMISLHSSKVKVHECSICGSEFGSGQALGGHMRRHRSNATTNSTSKIVNIDENVRNVVELDLNLPAPEDHHMDSKFIFSYSSQAPTLVGCQF
ncbi:zinc finger protein ZAT5-like [Apium graveolens]|uniref:zinc finger protein ZAT5-like n=1 Tax=Apium graveolens TaxID=4045 RepID=UPI003D79BE97